MVGFSIHNRSTKFIIGLNTVFQITGKVFSGATGFFVSVLVARNFGVRGFGDFTKITAFVTAFYLFADFGLNAVYLSQTSNQNEDNSLKHWIQLVILRLGLSFFLVFLALVILAFLPMGSVDGYTKLVRAGIVLFSPTIIFQAVITSANAYFQKKLRYDLATLSTAAGSLLSLVLIWWTSSLSNFNTAFVLTIVFLGLGSLTTAVASLIFVKIPKINLFGSKNFQQMVNLLKQSIPLGITLVFSLFYFRADSFILALTRTTSDVGIYGLAYKIFELPLSFATFFMNSVYPVMLVTLGSNKNPASNIFLALFKKSLTILLVSSFVLMVIMWFASPLVVQIKSDFMPSSTVLRILSLSLPTFFVTSLLMWSLVAFKRQITLMFIYGFAMFINIVLNLIFIPGFGYLAAAWITFVSEALVLLLSAGVVYGIIRKQKSDINSAI